jgi:hypothetical protein
MFFLGVRNSSTKDVTLLSRLIKYGMQLYGKQLNKPSEWIGSHATTLIKIYDRVYICESIDKGFVIHSLTASYDLDKEDYIIVRNPNGYTEDQKKAITSAAIDLSAVSITYNYLNFFQWALYILSGYISKKHRLNLFSKNYRRINYCYQSTKMLANIGDSTVFDNNNRVVSWFDIFVPEKQKIVFDHRL